MKWYEVIHQEGFDNFYYPVRLMHMIQTKSLLASKTFWVSFLQALAGAFVVFSTNYPQLGWLMLGKSIVDVLIRYYTTATITSIT